MHQLLKQMKKAARAASSLWGLFTVRPQKEIIYLLTLINFGAIKADGAEDRTNEGS